MLNIRRSLDRLIFNMGIPIPGTTVFILRQDPGASGLKMIRYKVVEDTGVINIPQWQD